METILGYMAGVGLHVGFKWASWKRADRKWGEYWVKYAGLNIAAAIAAVVCFGFWETGAIPALLEQMLAGAYLAVGLKGDPQVPMGFWGSLAAGYLMDSVARTLWMRFGDRIVKNGGNGGGGA